MECEIVVVEHEEVLVVKLFGDSEMSRHEIIVVYEEALSTKLMSLIKFNDGFVN